MQESKENIIWIVSYPRSGNTWFRVFLSNYLVNSKEPVNINQLHSTTIASSRQLIDNFSGTHSSDLTFDEIRNLRPEVYRSYSKEIESDIYVKTHDAWELNRNGQPIFPPEVTKAVIYIIRNPLDVAVSFSFHNNVSISKAISLMSKSGYGLCIEESILFNQLPQPLFSWSEHVTSWIHRSGLPVHVIRYEDMAANPDTTFSGALKFLKMDHEESRISRAIRNSSFENLKKQEETFGFKEKNLSSAKFFRSGNANNWKQHLTDSQVNKIIKDHHDIMEYYGYIKDLL